MAYSSFGQWKGTTKPAALVGSFGDFVAQRKADSAARTKQLEAEAKALAERQKTVDENTWAPVSLAWKAQADSTIGGAAELAASAQDLASGRLQQEDVQQGKLDFASFQKRERINKAANGRPINRGSQRYFDDAGVTTDGLDAQATRLSKIIAAGKQPGINKNYIEQTKQELALLREQRARIAKNGSPEETVVPALPPSAGAENRSLARAYNASANESRRLAQPFEEERGDGWLPKPAWVVEKAIQSAPLTVAGMAAGVVAGPAAAAGVVGAGVGLPEFGERKAAGEGDLEALGGATRAAAAEAAGTYIGAKALGGFGRTGSLGGFTAKSRVGRAGVAALGEGVDEDVTGALNIGSEIIYDGKKITVTEGVKRLIDAGAIGLTMGASTSAPAAYAMNPPATPEEAAENEAIIQQVMEAGENPGFGDGAEAASDIVPDLGQGRADQAKPAAKPKIETIAPESAYDAAQSGAVVAPVQIKSVEEISAEPETLAPIEPIQTPESADDFVFDPYAQDAEIQSSLTLGNRGAEVGFESELDYKGPRAKPPVDYLPAQPAPSATSVPETSREGLVKAREDALIAARAGAVALNDAKNYTPDTHNQNWSAFNAADVQLKAFDKSNGTQGPKTEFSQAAPTYLEGLTELGGRTDAFSTAIPVGNTVDEMAKSVFPQAKTFALPPQKGVPATGITIPEIGETAYIFESPYKVWIDVSELQSGQGGEAIYRIASARAKATGKRFVPDPNGMSGLAKARRPETILSEGVKHGNFDFLEPGDQVANYSGDQEQKSTALAERNIKTVVAAYPEMADIVTDGEKFVNAKTGEVITDAQFDAIASREPSQDVPEGYRAGRRTLKRTAFLNTFSPGRRETLGVAALAKLRQRQGNDLPKSLQKFLYSRAGDSVTGAARERIAKAFDRAFGAGSFGRAIASGRVNLHDSTSELPGTPDNAQGAYEHAHDGGGDVIHLFANNINEDNVAGVLLHEYTHRGFEASVGGLQEANKIYDVMRNIAKRDAELKAAYDRASAQVGTKNPNDLAREMLAYFLENRQNKGVPDGLFTAIANGVRKGLRAIGIKLKESDSEFKSKVMTIARKSLNSQIDADSRSGSATPKIEYSTAEQVNAERRASGSAALNPQIRRTNFDGFDISRGKIKSLKEALIDRTRLLKEIKNWQLVKGTYSAATDLHRKLNTYKDAMAGKTFGLKARQQAYINRIKEEGRDGQDFTSKDVGRWAALNMRDAEMQLGKPNTTGISDASAASQRQRLQPFKDKLDSLANVITDNHLEALDIRKNLLTQEQYEERLKNPDFVELRGYDNEALQGRLENAVPGVYGLNVAGQEYKAQRSRTGEPKYEDIIAYSFVDIEQAHMRTSWNEVALTIARFAIANPGNPFVQFHPATKITVRNEITGLDEVHHEQPALNKKYINFKHKGIPYSIKMTNERFIEAINSTSKEKGMIEKVLGPVMGKFQGAVLKTGNFLVIQKLRDAQEISLYLSLHFGPKVAAQALGLHVEAFGAFQRAMDGKPDLNNPTDVALKKWLDGGGLTQIAAPETVDAITKRIKNNLTPLGFKEGAADVVKAFTTWEGGFKGAKDAVGAMLDSAEASFDQSKAAWIGRLLEKYQTIGENIGRFTAYQAIMAANPNMNSDTAIWHSKESGANFSVRGSLAGTIGAVLPFYNAIAAGLLSNKNYFNNLRKNKKALAAFGAVVGIAVAAGMGNADDEDEDGNSTFLNLTAAERAGNFIFIWDGEVIKWPIPQGAVAAINMVAQSVGPMARLIAEGDEKGKERLYEDIWKGVLKNMGPDVGMTGEVDLGPWSSAVQAIQEKDEFGNNIEFRPEDEKWFEGYRSARAEHFLENFIPGYTKEMYKTGYAAVNANIRNDSMGSAYAVDKALEDVRGLPLFKIFLASASGKSQASKRILYDVKTAIDEEKADIKKVRLLEGVDVARDELEKSELLGESTMSRSGAITVRGDNIAGRASEQLKEVKKLRALKKRWYNGKDEFNDDLLDATSDIVNLDDINTDNFSTYRKMVMEKLKVEENRIFAEYKE